MDATKKIGLACSTRLIYGGYWLDVGYLASGYQENMDQFHGVGKQWILLLANGFVLLHRRLQRLEKTIPMAKSIWYELHYGLYADHVCEFQLHQQVHIPWFDTIYGRLLSGVDNFKQCLHSVFHSLANV